VGNITANAFLYRLYLSVSADSRTGALDDDPIKELDDLERVFQRYVAQAETEGLHQEATWCRESLAHIAASRARRAAASGDEE